MSGDGDVQGDGTCPDPGPSASRAGADAISPAQYDAIVQRARAAGFGIDTGAADVAVQLPDGSTRPGQRVRVEVRFPYVPVSSHFIGGRAIELRGNSTLLILR